MAEDKERYNSMEPVLHDINGGFIALSPEVVRRNNRFLNAFLNSVIELMKINDPLFAKLFQRLFYGGSYYDGLRVGSPDEYDLHMLMCLPEIAEPVLTISNVPGFVHLQLKNYQRLAQQSQEESNRKFRNFFDAQFYLKTETIVAWITGLLQKAINQLPLFFGNLDTIVLSRELKIRKSGPAQTIEVNMDGITMDIDLVPCFLFDANQWPQNAFRPNPFPSEHPTFFIVPKGPKPPPENQPIPRYWRMCFQEQERELMNDKDHLKPTIKLLKKLRDTCDHKSIASYYIKQVALWVVGEKEADFWNNSLSYVFMTVLKRYQEMVANGKIPYYWNKNDNLLGTASPIELSNIANRLKVIINDVERNIGNPTIIAKYLLDAGEYRKFILNY